MAQELKKNFDMTDSDLGGLGHADRVDIYLTEFNV